MGRSALNGLTIVGLVFVVIGAVVFATPVFQTHQMQNVAQIGALKLQAEQTKTYTIPPFLGGGALILGAALIAAGILRGR